MDRWSNFKSYISEHILQIKFISPFCHILFLFAFAPRPEHSKDFSEQYRFSFEFSKYTQFVILGGPNVSI